MKSTYSIFLIIFFPHCRSLPHSVFHRRSYLLNSAIERADYSSKSSTIDGQEKKPSDNNRGGSSSGAVLELAGVFVSVGNSDIINDVNWSIMPYERWGIVGRNGAGKSTLLRAITGYGGENLSVREGVISISGKARVGYLEQNGVIGSKLTVRDEVTSRMDRLKIASQNLKMAEDR